MLRFRQFDTQVFLTLNFDLRWERKNGISNMCWGDGLIVSESIKYSIIPELELRCLFGVMAVF